MFRAWGRSPAPFGRRGSRAPRKLPTPAASAGYPRYVRENPVVGEYSHSGGATSADSKSKSRKQARRDEPPGPSNAVI
jgi:hypothetical protein